MREVERIYTGSFYHEGGVYRIDATFTIDEDTCILKGRDVYQLETKLFDIFHAKKVNMGLFADMGLWTDDAFLRKEKKLLDCFYKLAEEEKDKIFLSAQIKTAEKELVKAKKRLKELKKKRGGGSNGQKL